MAESKDQRGLHPKGVRLFQARRGAVCAGFEVGPVLSTVVRAAPIIRSCVIGKELSRARATLEVLGYTVEEVTIS